MIRRAVVSLALQGQRLIDVYPDSHVSIHRSLLTWIGHLQPSPLSANYELGLEYHLADRPRVLLINPTLECRNGQRAKHLYPDDSLCLYYHPSREWHGGMVVADTIVPWTAEWLLHYELWLATGVWSGGGIHPERTEAASGRHASDHVHQ